MALSYTYTNLNRVLWAVKEEKPWVSLCDGGVILSLYVQPGARRTEWVGEHNEALKIRLAAPPVDGKANRVLLAWLAHCFVVPLRSVHLVAGEKSRQKRVLIDGILTVEDVVSRLQGTVSY